MRSRRNDLKKGAELLEFTLVLLPLLAMLWVIMDTGWAVFAKSTLQKAVRAGVRTGVTITAAQANAAGTCLTAMVKSTVQQNALGLLNGSTGLSKIKVNYLQPPDPDDTTGSATDVSTITGANKPGNIMQVSVQGYSLMPLVPRIFDWKTTPDKSPLNITVFSADLIEPSNSPPCLGTAP
jgi:Flp pilus assembly protein TadG